MLLIQLKDHLSAPEVQKEISALHSLRLCGIYIRIIQAVVDGCIADHSQQSLLHDEAMSDEDFSNIWKHVWDQLESLITQHLFTPLPLHQRVVNREMASDALRHLQLLKDSFIQSVYPLNLETALDQLVNQPESTMSQ